MKRIPLLAWCTVAVGLVAGNASAFTIDYWTGTLPTGWAGGITPASGDSIYLGRSVNRTVVLSGNTTVNSILFAPDGDKYYIDSAAPMTLSLTGGLTSLDNNFGRLLLEPNVTLSLTGTPALDAASNAVVIYNKVTGTVSPTLLGTSSIGSFIFVNSAGTNDYVGNTTVGDGTSAPVIVFWNGNPFGKGVGDTVTFVAGGVLIGHGSNTTVNNNLILNTAGPAGPNLAFRSTDAPLTLSGQVTLANNTAFQAQTSNIFMTFADGSGGLAVPGQAVRQPVIFTGNIVESGGARNLVVGGAGLVIFTPASGSNTYSGGTSVNGSLVFGNNNGIGAGANNVTVNSSGYVGLADLSAGNFAAQVAAHVNLGSSGAVGVDTLTGTPATFSDSINLSATSGNGTTPLGFTNGSARLGTATSAILTGSITPQGTNYQFGNGGGSLYVQSLLGDTAGNGATATRGLSLINTSGIPLKLYLQGNNSYSGGTSADGGFIIFDGAKAVPASGNLQAVGAATSVGGSYLGYTDTAGINGGSMIGSDPSAFFARFDKANTWGILGFDTHAGNATATINNVDLTGFNDGVFIGTATSAILTGTLTPTSVANAPLLTNTLRLTAGNGGTLTVNSTIADNGSPVAVAFGTPAVSPSFNPFFANGTIIVNGNNSYSNGTGFNTNPQGLTIGFGNNNAFGTGGIFITSDGGGLVGLRAESAGLDLANPISFQNNADLHLVGDNAFTLSGAITSANGSYNTIQVQRAIGATAGDVTLAHDNSGFVGEISIQNSKVTLSNNYAAGQAQIFLYDTNATLAFFGGATAPVLHGLRGDTGHVYVPDGTTLRFQMDDDTNHDGDFGGVISRADGGVSTASLVVDANNNNTNQTLYLHGHNLYSGGTTISNYGVLGLGFSDSAGSGAITLNATDGGLILNTGVTLTNALVFNSGGLAGLGAFAPSGVSGTNQTAGKITFGANQMVFPGIPGGDIQMPGVLTLQTNVAFLNGGTLREMIQDPSLANTITGSPATNVNGGYGFLDVQGTLDLSLLNTSFLIALESVDATYGKGYSSQIILGQNYSLPFVKATSITGFDPTKFSFDASEFQSGLMANTVFNVTSDGTYLYLNFTPVPEPSTWALLGAGLSLMGLRAWRRRT